MALSRDQFVTEIADVCGKSENASAISGALLSARIRTYLNFAQKRIARAYNFNELDSLKEDSALVVDLKRYPLTTGTSNLGLTRLKDIRSIRLIDSENSRKLTMWNYRRYDKAYPRPENFSTGRPSIYVRDGTNLEFFKIPDDTYTLHIRYAQWATDFSTGTQESDFKDKDQLILVAGILETYIALEEYSDAGVFLARFKGLIKEIINAEGDSDWEPESQPHAPESYSSGEPWLDPFGVTADPLYGYNS